MSTPAQDRLERLLANKARPPKPEQTASALDRPADQSNEAIVKRLDPNDSIGKITTIKDGAVDVRPPTVLGSSDEDDDYAAIFVKRPEMRIKSINSDNIRGPKDTAETGGRNLGRSKLIDLVPDGKQSADESDHLETSPENTANFKEVEDDQRFDLKQFCVLSMVAKFPYKYMKDPDDRVSKRFFASNKFYDRHWSLYYLYPPRSFNKQPLILIPHYQVQQLLDEISTTFNVNFKLPEFPFQIDFADDGTPRPIFLGRSSSRQDVTRLTEQIPNPQSDHAECPPNGSLQLKNAYETYHTKIEKVLLASKSKSSGSNHQKAGKLFQSVQESQDQLKRVQRYFGLRPSTRAVELVPCPSGQEDDSRELTRQWECGMLIQYLDPRRPAVYLFENQPVIISVDVEAYERNHDLITEIGISTLDTLDLLHLNPGFAGEEWVKQIRSRHFRLSGREHLINKDFCVGNPDAFEFGRSEFVRPDNISDVVDSCFEWPFSINFKKPGSNSQTTSIANDIRPENSEKVSTQQGPKIRNIILLGHDIGADLNYLQKLGSAVFDPMTVKDSMNDSPVSSQRHRILTSILETIDTATLYKTFKNDAQPRSLGHICTSLGINTWFLHNAGNDARYTLEALVNLLIKARLEQDEQHRKRNPDAEGIVEDQLEVEQMRQADQRIKDARQKMQQKLMTKISEDDPPIDAQVQPEGSDDGVIDWSLPFRGEKVLLKKKKHKKPGSSKEGSSQAHHVDQEETATDTDWTVQPSHAVPKRGW